MGAFLEVSLYFGWRRLLRREVVSYVMSGRCVDLKKILKLPTSIFVFFLFSPVNLILAETISAHLKLKIYRNKSKYTRDPLLVISAIFKILRKSSYSSPSFSLDNNFLQTRDFLLALCEIRLKLYMENLCVPFSYPLS